MKNYIYTFILAFCINTLTAQTIYEEFESYKLGETREIKIQLPRNYDENIDQSYPLFIVFDGDYMFEVVAGNVDYYSYWEDMPEAIVIGINQSDTRNDDCYYSEQNDLPVESGANFFEFIGMELIPHIENNYRTENFRVAVGHGETANFINYFMLKAKPLFQAYIVVSPSLAPSMNDYISQRLQQYETKLFYYLATASNDIKSIKKDTETLNATITSIDNKNILYNFDNFEGATHYSAPAHAIPKALESIFYVFQPISKKEYKESILTLETSPVEYLLDKYKVISDLFGIDKQILINDFKAIVAAIKKKEQWEYFEDLGKLARKEYPETVLGNYYLARFYEENGQPKKAMRTYRSAYVFEEIAGITKDDMLDRADRIKADFGY
ncbi:esterase [Flavobacteriaceae bacterium PRS1]|nr:esterase [Flavobacteriaceae bacterium PRS1]